MRVYIAGALSNKNSVKDERTPTRVVVDYLGNVNNMCRKAGVVRKAGLYPFVPALDLLLGVVDGGFEESDYRETGMKFLEVCDVVYVISRSAGVEAEIGHAKAVGIPVVYSFDALLKAKDKWESVHGQI